MFGWTKASGPRVVTISGEEAATRVRSGKAVLVDVREDTEWQAGHVDGAIHVAFSRFASDVGRIPTDKEAILYCAAGLRSERALTACANLGLAFDTHVKGGISALAKAGLKVS